MGLRGFKCGCPLAHFHFFWYHSTQPTFSNIDDPLLRVTYGRELKTTIMELSAALHTPHLYPARSGSLRNSLSNIPSVMYLTIVRSDVQSSNLMLYPTYSRDGTHMLTAELTNSRSPWLPVFAPAPSITAVLNLSQHKKHIVHSLQSGTCTVPHPFTS